MENPFQPLTDLIKNQGLGIDYVRSECNCGLKHIRLESKGPGWLVESLQRSWKDDGIHALPGRD